jgi:hypothetical protein
MGKSIVFDEPSYALGKRDWFKELQKVLVHTMESQRFLIHPLFVPIINLALLDKTIRAYLLSHVVHVVGRGHARVYRLKPSQRTEKVYWYNTGEIYYRLFDSDKCDKDSCLGCKQLDANCQIFRAQYERKKRTIQFERYEQGEDEASQKEAQQLTEEQIEKLLMPHLAELLTASGRLHVGKIRVYLRENESIRISDWKARQIRSNIEGSHPELFEQD